MSETEGGGWTVTKNSWSDTTVYGADGRPICTLHLSEDDVTEDNQDEMEAQQAAIARLISAAPMLLEALIMQEELAALRMSGDPAANIAFVRNYRRKALARAGEPPTTTQEDQTNG